MLGYYPELKDAGNGDVEDDKDEHVLATSRS